MARSTDFPGPDAPEAPAASRAGRSRPDIAPADDELADDELEDELEEDERGEALGTSYDEPTDWRRVGLFGAGLAIGLAVGAGVALLVAPQSGAETRDQIGERARGLRDRAAGRWDDLRDEIRWAVRRGRTRARRKLIRSRWATEDFVERKRSGR